MKIFSHRGFHQDVPENTLEAFEAAIALGVDGIETDIRVSADGIAVLHHDPILANGNEIKTLTFAQIQAQSSYAIPRLEEALELNTPTEFCWNLELKNKESFLITERISREQSISDTILFTSFWHDGIVEMIQRSPNIPRSQFGLLWGIHPYGFQQPQWFEHYPQITTLVFYQERLSAELIQHCHQKSLSVGAFGDRTPEHQAQLSAWGTDILITDYP